MSDLFKSYWRVGLTLLIAIGFGLYSFVGTLPTDVDGLAALIALVMTSILSLQVAESFDLRSRFQAIPEDINHAVRDALREHDPAQIVPFEQTADYMELFDGLVGTCCIYNPHQFAPDTLDIDPEQIIASTVRRYQSRDFLAMRYLICVGDEYGRKNFTRFCARLQKVHRLSSHPALVADKVRVGVLPGKSFSQEPTYHVQQKRGERSVMELRLAPLTIGGGNIPSFYLVSSSASFRALLQSHFQATWIGVKEIQLSTLFEDGFDVNEQSVAKLLNDAQAH